MKVVLVNFATAAFRTYQEINTLTAKRFGIEEIYAFGPHDIDQAFTEKNKTILSSKRGAGYWLWKPYFVARVMADLSDGDLLFYADAAMHFINPLDAMITSLEASGLDLMIAGEAFLESQYTKRDAFILMEADSAGFEKTPQRLASCFLLRRSPWSASFLDRYLNFALDPRILTDRPNSCGQANYPGFIDHRHDQSIFSLMSKIENIPVAHNRFVAEGHLFGHEQIINHTRAHQSPRDIAKKLLIEGVLTLKTLEILSSVD